MAPNTFPVSQNTDNRNPSGSLSPNIASARIRNCISNFLLNKMILLGIVLVQLGVMAEIKMIIEFARHGSRAELNHFDWSLHAHDRAALLP